MASNFKRNTVVAGTTRTSLYGPVPAGTTAIVFGGTFTNIDRTNKSDHIFTLEIRSGTSTYTPRLMDTPVPFGGASKSPKMVLTAGEYLFVTADAASAIQATVEILERT